MIVNESLNYHRLSSTIMTYVNANMIVWYDMVSLFICGISFRYIYIQVEKTSY